MSMERIATLIASGVGSAAGFYVITQSGLAGTLIGASVAAIVYVGTAQWLAPSGKRWPLDSGQDVGKKVCGRSTARRRGQDRGISGSGRSDRDGRTPLVGCG